MFKKKEVPIKERVVTIFSSCYPYCVKEKCQSGKWLVFDEIVKMQDGSTKTVSQSMCSEAWLAKFALAQLKATKKT